MTTPETARSILSRLEAGEPLRLLLGTFPALSEIVLAPALMAQLRAAIMADVARMAGGDEPDPATPFSAEMPVICREKERTNAQ